MGGGHGGSTSRGGVTGARRHAGRHTSGIPCTSDSPTTLAGQLVFPAASLLFSGGRRWGCIGGGSWSSGGWRIVGDGGASGCGGVGGGGAGGAVDGGAGGGGASSCSCGGGISSRGGSGRGGASCVLVGQHHHPSQLDGHLCERHHVHFDLSAKPF